MSRNRFRWGTRAALVIAALLGGQDAATAADAPPLVLISIDGLLPEYYLTPDQFGLAVPNLRALVQEGAYATGATSVMPSNTFPAHTTMITGVDPRKHGIARNTIFDPDGTLGGGWHWYYDDIKVPTLFDKARAAGLKTAAVTWPVTAGGPVDLNLPDMYPVPNLREAKNLISLARNANGGILADVLPPAQGLVKLGDEVRTRVAVRFLQEKPALLAVHLLELDSAHHRYGPRSPQAFATIERIDTYLGQIFNALRADQRWNETTVMVVSDHGFLPFSREVRVGVLLRALGLVRTNSEGQVVWWRAMVDASGGTAGIFMHPEASDADRRKVDDVVQLLLGNTAYGVARAIRRKDVDATGGYPGAYVILEAEPPFAFGGSVSAAEVVVEVEPGGAHGHSPSRPELRAAFIARGPNIRRNKNLGLIRLHDVAPTAARVLGLDMNKVQGRVLTDAFTVVAPKKTGPTDPAPAAVSTTGQN